jgi:type IV pilus assembly protein PilB
MNTEQENSLSSGLLRALVNAHQITLEMAHLTEQTANAKGFAVHDWMLQQNALNSTLAARLTAEMYNTPLLDLDAMGQATLAPLSAQQITQIHSLGALPLQVRADRIAVAMADPCDLMRLQSIARITGLKPFAVVVEADKLALRLRASQPVPVSSDSTESLGSEIPQSDPAAATRFLQKYLLQALADGASEVHLQPQGNCYRLRSRGIQGMKLLAELPNAAGENINDMLENQPCFELTNNTAEPIVFDVLSVQSQHGVRRVLRRSVMLTEVPTLEELGLNSVELDTIRSFLNQTEGRICAVSANDSAQQVRMLHAMAAELDAQRLNIFSLESPIAGALNGCTQITMQSLDPSNNDALLTLCLQQSPDILMMNAPEKYLSEAGLQKALAWACLPGHCLLLGVQNALLSRYPAQAYRLQLHVTDRSQKKLFEMILHAGTHG